MSVDVQLDVSPRWRQQLAGRGRHADHIAHATDVDDHEVRSRAPHHATEVGDHLVAAALVKRRLRAWQMAIAIASRACSSSRPSGIFTWAASMRAICALSALP